MFRRPVGSLVALAFFALTALLVPIVPAANEEGPPGLLVALKGHKEAVYSIAFTADGKYILTGSGDPSIKVWEAATGKELKTFAGPNGHKGLILSVAVAPDGTQFATAGADNTARIWDFPGSKSLRDFPATADTRAVAVSPDGNRVAAGALDGTILLWNTTDGKTLQTLKGHTGAINGLAFSPNNQTLVSVGEDATLRFWNATDGKELSAFAAHPGAVRGVAFSPSGNAVYTIGSEGSLRFWSVPPTATRTLQPPFTEGVASLALTPDGAQILASAGPKLRVSTVTTGQLTKEYTAKDAVTCSAALTGAPVVVAGTQSGTLQVWQSKEGQLLQSQPVHAGGVTGVALHPGGSQFATVGKDGMVRLFNLPTTAPRTIAHPDLVRTAVLSPDGKRLATGGADKTIRLYRLDNLKTPERQLTGQPGPLLHLAFSADAKSLASSGDDGILRISRIEKGDQSHAIGAHAAPLSSLTWANDRLLTSSLDGTFKVWQAPTSTTTGKGVFAHAGAVTCATLTPDGARLISGSDDKQVRSWNLSNGQLERTWTGPTLGILCLTTSARGDLIAAGSADRSVFIWEAGGSKVVQKLTGLPAAVHSVALSPDNKLILAGLADGTLRIHDLTSGKEVRSLDGHKGSLNSLALSPKGDQLFTAGADGVVLLRPLAGGPATQTWKHGSAIQSIALTRDGTKLAVGGSDKLVKIYNATNGMVETTLTTPAEVRSLTFSSDGKKLAVAGSDNRARLYSSDGSLEEYFMHEGPVHAVVFAADGKRLFSTSADKTVRVWTPALLWQGRHTGGVRQVTLSPRGDRVFSAGEDGTVGVWAYADGKPAGSFRAHQGAVVGLTLSSDAARLVTVGADRSGRSWDLSKLAPGKTAGKDLDKPTLAFALPASPISVSLTPNATRLAIGVEEKGKQEVLLVEETTGSELLRLEAGAVPAGQLAFLPDGRTLLAAGSDRSVQLLDVNILSAFEAHKGGCSGVAFLENGTQLVTSGADGSARLWTLATRKLERTFGPLPAAISAMQLSRPGTHLAAVSDKALRVWTIADGKETLAIEMPSPARAVSFNNDRSRLATANEDGRLRVWDAAQKVEIQGFLHGGPVTGASFSPSNPALLVSSSLDKSVGIHTITNTRTVALGTPLQTLAVAPNSTHVLVGGGDGKIRLVNSGNGNVERTCEDGDKATTSVAVARSGQLIAAGSVDRKVRLFNYQDGKLLSAFTAPAEPKSLSFSPNNQALIAVGADGSITTWDVVFQPGQPLPAEFGKVLQTYQHGTSAADISFPTTGAIFYTAGADRSVKAWKLASDQAIRSFPHPNTVNTLAYDRAGKMLVTGGGDGKLRLFDLAKGNQLREINAHPSMTNDSAIYGVAFSPDGSQVITAGKDNSLRLFTVADGKQVREFKAYKEKEFPRGHQDAVLCVAFSPDGKQLASGSADRTIKIWNVADGMVLREFSNPSLKPSAPNTPPTAHPGWIYNLRWSEDGKKILSVGGAPRLRGYLAAWETASGKLLFGKELDIGTIFALALSPKDTAVAIGTGGSVRSDRDLNLGLILKMPN